MTIELVTTVGVRIIWVVWIPIIGIREAAPDEDSIAEERVIKEKAVMKEKTITVEEVAVVNKTVIETAVAETTVKPSPHVAAKRPRGDR